MTTKKTTPGTSGKPVTSEKAFTIERTFKASPDRLWALWTTKQGVESWWGPEGFTTTVHALDLRPGGVFDFEMTATAPEQVAALKELGLPPTSRTRNVYLEVVEPRRLAIKTRIDFVPGVEPYEITSTVDFVKVREGTKLVFTSTKMHSEEWGELARQGQVSQMEKLGRLLGEVGPASPGHRAVILTLPSDREILISRVFDAPPERVYRAHVDPKALVAWWGPTEYVNTIDTWEPREGGAWRIVQRAPDGTEHAFRGVFREVVPPRRITWTFEYEPQAGHIATQTVTFEPERGGKTLLTVRVAFADQADRDGMLASGMEWGMRQGYERLDDVLAHGA